MIERNRDLVGAPTVRSSIAEREGLPMPKHLGIVVPHPKDDSIAALFNHYERGEGEGPAHITLIYPHVEADPKSSTKQLLFTGRDRVVLQYLGHVLKIDERTLRTPTQSTIEMAGVEHIVLVATTSDAQEFLYPELHRYQQAGITVIEICDQPGTTHDIQLGTNHREIVTSDTLIKSVEAHVGVPREE